MGELIAVLSGKGGTGKTTICAGLAEALASGGESVLCIDCDVGLRNLDIALGMSDVQALSFVELYKGEYSLDAAARHPDYPTLAFLTAPVSCRADEIDEDAFLNLLQEARKQFRYVFLDAPAGVDRGFDLAAKYAERIVLVTGFDPASIRDAQRAGQLLELMGKTNVRLIVNRVSKKMVASMKITVDDIMDEAGLPLLGLVPEDADVVLSAGFKKPLLRYSKKGAAKACKRIAKRIIGYSVPIDI